ncbi:MAG: MlaD family protein [bacterium]
MKKEVINKIKLGVFVAAGIAVFTFVIYFIGQKQQMFRSTFRISGVFKDVAGLQAGNNVRFAGINVGTVETIKIISDSSVSVEILIDEDTRKYIKKDAVANIGSDGLIGNKILIISPGTGGKKVIENNDVIQTTPPINMDEILISIKKTIDNTTAITGDLSVITNNIQAGKGVIGRMLMDKDLEQNFDTSIVSLKNGMDAIFVSFKKTIDNTTAITSDLSVITNNIQAGNGLIGRMLMDKELEQNFDTSVVSLKNGLEGLNTLIMNTQQSFSKNFDSTFVNLKEGSAAFKLLMKKAKSSWLLWGF